MMRVSLRHSPLIVAIASLTTVSRFSTSFRCVAHHSRWQQQLRKNDKSMSILSSDMSSLPPLIDVDCNLCHVDLQSLLPRNDKSNTSGTDDGMPQIGDILSEDAVAESNIVAMLSPSSTLEEAQRSIQFVIDHVNRNQGGVEIRTTVGVHPYHVNELGSPESHFPQVQKLLQQHSRTGSAPPHDMIAAIGECGLDASDGFPPLQDQIPWFKAQVQWAKEFQLPLFVHERLAFDETICILDSVLGTMTTTTTPAIKMDPQSQDQHQQEQQHDVPIIIHCFTGTREECAHYIARGYSLSVSGFIIKDAGKVVRECLTDGIIPLDRLMIETDAPYMGFPKCRDQWMVKQQDHVASLNSKQRKRLQSSTYPNVPSALPMILDQVLECINQGRMARGEDPLTREYVAQVTTRNAILFFGFKKQPVLDI